MKIRLAIALKVIAVWHTKTIKHKKKAYRRVLTKYGIDAFNISFGRIV